ncbi:MAG TPA: Uma2 family endonuclease [Nocardioides sp.]|nr:Uma2 family endonuclease [Nocardioides sp.]
MSTSQGADVSAAPHDPEERLIRRPMSLEDYLALPEGRVEWVEGEAIFMNASPRARHQRIAAGLAILIEEATGLFCVAAVGFWTRPHRKSRIPDVLATKGRFDESWAPTTPVLCVEVLSPSTRSEDLVRKSHEYAAAGVEQYWVVDPAASELRVYSNNGDGWDESAVLDAEHPTATIQIGDHGEVEIDLERLLRR